MNTLARQVWILVCGRCMTWGSPRYNQSGSQNVSVPPIYSFPLTLSYLYFYTCTPFHLQVVPASLPFILSYIRGQFPSNWLAVSHFQSNVIPIFDCHKTSAIYFLQMQKYSFKPELPAREMSLAHQYSRSIRDSSCDSPENTPRQWYIRLNNKIQKRSKHGSMSSLIAIKHKPFRSKAAQTLKMPCLHLYDSTQAQTGTNINSVPLPHQQFSSCEIGITWRS